MTHQTVPFFPSKPSRTHEVCGAGALVFALALAARLGGPVLWVREGWKPDRLHPVGLLDFIDPADLLICNTKDQIDVLATAEEALRSGAAPLVVMELGKPYGLTEGRRLQLAAKEGKATGLAVIPDGMGSNAAETRWKCTPVFDPVDSTLQRWELIKNKSGTLGVWDVRWDATSRRVIMVPPAGK